jgi:multisubunit Na+/H+ antiporter MnhB subunit
MKKILIICLVLILSVLVYGEEKMKNRIKFRFRLCGSIYLSYVGL